MIMYLVMYKLDHSMEDRCWYFTFKPDATWRELQQWFDPNYHYNTLRFFPVGKEITL